MKSKIIKRRSFLKGSAATLGALTIGGSAPYYFMRNIAKAAESDTIKVGILHSLSGTIAIISSPSTMLNSWPSRKSTLRAGSWVKRSSL